MDLTVRIAEDLKTAMKNKEKEKLEAIRAVKTAFLLAKTEKGAEENISQDAQIKIIQKLIKQRKESAKEYSAQNRDELAEKELFEASVIAEYLPPQLSEEEIEKEVEMIIKEVGATSIKEMGKVMGVASSRLAGKCESQAIAAIVKKSLQ